MITVTHDAILIRRSRTRCHYIATTRKADPKLIKSLKLYDEIRDERNSDENDDFASSEVIINWRTGKRTLVLK